jgi:hypothetical protein
LHKYVYGNGNPVNTIDPSGNRGALVNLAIATIIIGVLSAISVYAGHKFYSSYLKEPTPQHKIEKYAQFLERTVELALVALKQGCAPNDLPDNDNIDAYLPNFAKVKDPSKVVDSTWRDATSSHAPNAKESEPLSVAPQFAIKFYDDRTLGDTISIVHVTGSLAHGFDFISYKLGAYVNHRNATELRPYLTCTPEIIFP